MITDNQLQSIIKTTCRLQQVPMNATFNELGLSAAQLQKVQKRFIDIFHRTTKDLKFSDTVYTVTEKLNGKF